MLSFGHSAVFMILVYLTELFFLKERVYCFLVKKGRKVTPQNCVLGRNLTQCATDQAYTNRIIPTPY